MRRIDVAPAVQGYSSGYVDPYYQNVSYITGNVQWQVAPPPRYEDLEIKTLPSGELALKGPTTGLTQVDSDATQELPNYTNIKN